MYLHSLSYDSNLKFLKKDPSFFFAVNLPSDLFPLDWERTWTCYTHNVQALTEDSSLHVRCFWERRGVSKAPLLSFSTHCPTPSELLCSPSLHSLLLEPHHTQDLLFDNIMPVPKSLLNLLLRVPETFLSFNCLLTLHIW